MRTFLGAVAFASVLGSTHAASANSCNLYAPYVAGSIRPGCEVTTLALPEVSVTLPAVTRAGVTIAPTVVADQVTLPVTFESYPSPDSCELVARTEQRTFARQRVTWPALQPGDEILLDGAPYTVPGPGPCDPPTPWFACQDPIQFCGDDAGPGAGGDGDATAADGGCSAGGGGGLAGVLGALLVIARRRRAGSV